MSKKEKNFSEYLFDDKLKISVCDLSKDICIDTDVDYIVHTARVTKSKEMVQYPVDNIDVSINGTRNMLELARKKNVKGMVYLSSMEVYGQMEVSDHKISEHELDILIYQLQEAVIRKEKGCVNVCVMHMPASMESGL